MSQRNTNALLPFKYISTMSHKCISWSLICYTAASAPPHRQLPIPLIPLIAKCISKCWAKHTGALALADAHAWARALARALALTRTCRQTTWHMGLHGAHHMHVVLIDDTFSNPMGHYYRKCLLECNQPCSSDSHRQQNR